MTVKEFILSYNKKEKPEALLSKFGLADLEETETIALLFGVNVNDPTIVPAQLDFLSIQGQISEDQYNELKEILATEFENTSVHLFEQGEKFVSFSLVEHGGELPQKLLDSVEVFVHGENTFSGGLESELFGSMPASIYEKTFKSVNGVYNNVNIYLTTRT